MVAMGRVEWKAVAAAIPVMLSALGIARIASEIAGFPASAAQIGGAVSAGIGAWLILALVFSRSSGENLGSSLESVGWRMSAGLVSWISLPLKGLLASASSLTFSQIGILRIGGDWIAVSPENYVRLCIMGLALAGIVIAQAAMFWRNTAFPLTAAAVALALVGFWRVLVFPPTGDEPYMLMSVYSLIEDGDLDLRDDFGGKAEAEISPRPLFEDFIAAHRVNGRKGELFSRHGILPSLLYLPGYALWGRMGVQLMLAAAWAFLLALIRRILVLTGAKKGPALTVTALFAIASPLPIFGIFLGPDLLCALGMALGLTALIERRRIGFLICVALLPWIHHKAALSAAGLVMGASVLRGARWGAACAGTLLASLGLMLGLLAAFTDIPAWPPWALMGFSSANYHETFSLSNVPVSLLATLFDRHQGIIHYPALLSVFAGVALLWRNSAKLAIFICACAAPYLAALVTYSQWHGGPGAPGRLLVLILPVAALPMAAAVGVLQKPRWGRLVLGAIFGLGALFSWLLAGIPALAFVSARRRIESAFSGAMGFDPLIVLPEFRDLQVPAIDYVKALFLLAFLVFLSVFLIRRSRRGQSRFGISGV